jgi:hypothetical protein
MNDILTNGTEIKQRIIAEINNARQCIYLAMAWFTDRDIANAIIKARNRNVTVDIILSSNEQNNTVKQMFRGVNINVHSFETGDARGMMHHKFCLIDGRISISGSYNYSYNASNNNVENIQVSDDSSTYKQLLAEFERLKYNIDNNLDINSITQFTNMPVQPKNSVDNFVQQLSDRVYLSAQINTDDYKKQGFEKSKESGGNIDIFKTECANIKEQICSYTSNDNLSNKKNILISNIDAAFASKKSDLDTEKTNEINTVKTSNELENKQIANKIAEIKREKEILESGNPATGERGLFQINKDIEKNKLEKRAIEQSLVVNEFWTVGTILALLGLCIFVFYLLIFFASAIYKMLLEERVILAALEAGVNPGLPQLINPNAIIEIFKRQGSLFGILAIICSLIPTLLSNLGLLSTKKWVNLLCFWIGLLFFDIVASGMVALNTDKINCLLVGQTSKMQFWEVIEKGEFYLIFFFGALPLLIMHYLIGYVVGSYKKSNRAYIDAEKDKQIKLLDEDMIDLNASKEALSAKITKKEDEIRINNEKITKLETDLNTQQNQIENKYVELQREIKDIYNDFHAKITSGRIFTDEILNGIISAYKSGFIEYLPNYYSGNEVANRVQQIEDIIKK